VIARRSKRVLACAAFALVLALPAAAEAAAPVDSFSVTPISTGAGGHGDLRVDFSFDLLQKEQTACDCNYPRDITVTTPPGLLGFPSQIPRCTLAEYSTLSCPTDSQVGVAYAEAGGGDFFGGSSLAVFNMVPSPDQAALLAFPYPILQNPPVFTSFTVRTESDFGLEAKTFGIINIQRTFQLAKFSLIFWGIPGDPLHEELRFPFGGIDSALLASHGYQFICHGVETPAQLVAGINPLREPDGDCASEASLTPQWPWSTPYNATVEPFLTNPTNCTGAPQQSSIDVLAYDEEHASATASFPPITGCEQLSFNPSLTGKPTTTQAESPSGLDVELKVPVPSSPEAPSPSQIRGTRMLLPEGFTVNSAAADGKEACSDAEARFGTREEAQCPESAKIGTLAVHSSALPGALPGALYLGAPLPGNRYRVFLTANGFSLHVKLAGRAVPDPVTGQLQVIFENLPQAPFQRFDLHVFGGEKGLLTTPTQCGTYPVKTTFTPWDNLLPDQESTQFFTIDSGPNGTPCPSNPRPFDPTLDAGVVDNSAGRHTPFSLRLARNDGNQNITGLTVKTPPGFSGTLKGIPYCSEVALGQLALSTYSGLIEQATPACGAASQLGTVNAAAGAGTKPLHAPGKVYLAGPYKGAPLSLVAVIPAVSGPYDLGNVAVRAAIKVDPVTARITTVSDPLPQILEGIPLRTREIQVNLDRPDFVLNPTNCGPHATEAQLSGDQGASAALSAHFQVANCASLPFAPQLNLRLKGSAKRAGTPALRAVLSANPGDANLAGASVALPRSEILDQAHIRTICTRVQFAEGAGNGANCPPGSVYGQATVITPLLDQPLEGPVILRSTGTEAGAHILPDLVMALHGQVDFDASARIDSINGGIRSTFESIPDVPVSKVVLEMQGGAKGLLENSRNLCQGKTPKASAKYSGQNGTPYDVMVALRSSACQKAARHRRHKRSQHHHAGRAGH
jgi:hypothetical protein